MSRLLLCAALACGVGGTANAEALHLSCRGVAQSLNATTSYGSVRDDDGNRATGNMTTYSQRQSPDRTLVEIDGDAGRIRAPASLVPALRGGGSQGWWPLRDIVIGDTQITARFSLNFMNKPRVLIDRRTGEILIDGFGAQGFAGECEVFAPEPEARKF